MAENVTKQPLDTGTVIDSAVASMTFADIVTSVSALIAAISFVYGIRAWQREFVGKRRIELAEDVLALAYEVEEIIQSIRSPFSSNKEGQSRAKKDWETEAETELLNRAYVVIERFEKREDRIANFRALKYRFMATFGQKSGEPFDKIDRTIRDIFLSANMLGTHYWPRQGRAEMTAEEFQQHLDEMHKHERVFWDMGHENDEIGPRISAAIEDIEQYALKAAQRPSIFRQWWKR